MDTQEENLTPVKEKKKDKVKKEKKAKTGRTVETMYRSTLTNQLQLSQLADQKANLLVSVNAIIISIMASLMLQELGARPALLLPTVLLVGVCLTTITLALWATRPSVNPQPIQNDIEPTQQMDLLFFADYTALSMDEYKEVMQGVITKEAVVHEVILKNIYAQGQVMKRKYRLIKTAYTVFMIGFPLAVVTYLVMFYWAAN
ncbi:MAG: DUF5706 domain-containing protein [Spirosomaceae bacterium]|jgi:hypothetical protein|nr:DUF5706 domain-containing protein [Spirosomataceae bacterium]